MNIKKSIVFVLLLSQCVFAQNQEHILDKSKRIDVEYVFVDETNKEKRSAIGCVKKMYRGPKKKVSSRDTCYFSNTISEHPKYLFQSKVRLEELKDNVWRYYLVYNKSCFSNALGKDSIPLEGYFKTFDTTKPNYPILGEEEPSLYRKPNIGDFNDAPTLKTVPLKATTNSEGWFKKGLKDRKWTYKSSDFARIEAFYKDGMREGTYNVYNTKDSILYQTVFVKGTGIEKIYRKNGSMYHIKHFKNGNLDYSKPYEIYYNNNRIAFRADYEKGIVTHYYKNGTVFKVFHVKMIEDRLYKEGVYWVYNESGTLKEKRFYNKNKSVYTIYYNDKERIETIESGNMIQHYKKGKLKKIMFRKE